LCVVLAGLGVVRRRAEDDHGDSEEEEEHSELSHAGLDGQTEDAQTVRVFRQFEDAEDAQDASEQERAAAFLTARSNTGRQHVHCLQCVRYTCSRLCR